VHLQTALAVAFALATVVTTLSANGVPLLSSDEFSAEQLPQQLLAALPGSLPFLLLLGMLGKNSQMPTYLRVGLLTLLAASKYVSGTVSSVLSHVMVGLLTVPPATRCVLKYVSHAFSDKGWTV
jgi:hypothetical protein